MKGNSVLFPNWNSSNDSSLYVNGVDYNTANSSSVKKVDTVEYISEHKVPELGTPNSVKKNYDKDGNLASERYYDNDGKPYPDIDYTDHGNRKTHPNVPHEHEITVDDEGNMYREKEKKV